MSSLIQLKKATPVLLVGLVLACFALSPRVQAVSPAPDGGYAGNNTAEGTSALFSLTSGIDNTALGFRALYHNNGNYNTAEGFGALYSNTSGTQNTANGVNALISNTTGNNNTANGVNTLFSNTTGNNNTANGFEALYSNTLGIENTATGYQALFTNTTGNNNTANGFEALSSNTDGVQNTATGGQALYHNRTIGGISGSNNTANGFDALFHNTNGIENTAIGASALSSNTTGGDNTANGHRALYHNTNASSNTANGVQALQNNTIGSLNIALGVNAGYGVTTAHNVICIGANGQNVDHSCYIGQIFGATSSGGIAVFVNSNGRLGTATSSRRFKDDIKPMDKASEALFALKPVTFRYKKEIDPAGTSQFGLVAEEVEKVNPDLVVRDKEGKPYSVRYEAVNAMLLNEFLKEHRKNEAQQKQIDVLTAQLKEQAAQIQKVSAQLEASKPAPQVVNNP